MHYLQVARLISEAISEANLSQVRPCCLLAAVLMNQNLTLIAAVLHWMVPVLVIALAISSSSNKFACSHLTWTSAAAHDYGVCRCALEHATGIECAHSRARVCV
jgi:hypothetical protein